MKKITVYIPDDKMEEFDAFIKKLNISVNKESYLQVEEWQRDEIVVDESSSDYISSDEIEKTNFDREGRSL